MVCEKAVHCERAKPVFADIEPDTANIDPGLIEDAITPRMKAILPVDAFGQPARLDTIRDIADRSKTCLGHAAQGRASTCPSCAE